MAKFSVGTLLVTKNNPDEVYKVHSISSFNVLIVYRKQNLYGSWGAGWNYAPREIEAIFDIYVPYNNIWCDLNA